MFVDWDSDGYTGLFDSWDGGGEVYIGLSVEKLKAKLFGLGFVWTGKMVVEVRKTLLIIQEGVDLGKILNIMQQ